MGAGGIWGRSCKISLGAAKDQNEKTLILCTDKCVIFSTAFLAFVECRVPEGLVTRTEPRLPLDPVAFHYGSARKGRN